MAELFARPFADLMFEAQQVHRARNRALGVGKPLGAGVQKQILVVVTGHFEAIAVGGVQPLLEVIEAVVAGVERLAASRCPVVPKP